MNKLYEELKQFGDVDADLPLSKMTTLRIGGTAKYTVYPENLVALDSIMRVIAEYGVRSKVIGKGKLEAIEISQVDERFQPIPGTEKRFDVDTLLLSIGLIPNNDLLDKMGIPTSSTRGSEVNDNLETAIPGVFSCGNVLHVHDLVDYVVEEGRVAGLGAAKYLKGELKPSEHVVPTKPGEGIGYVVPARVELENCDDNVVLKFRVRKPRKEVYIVYAQGENVIKRVYKPAIIPSEMEIVKLPKASIVEGVPLTVSLVDKEVK